MAKSHVELDFFGLHNLPNPLTQPPPPPQPRLDRRQSFRGISKINPEIVKNVIASSKHVASEKTCMPASHGQLPVFHAHHHPFSRGGSMEKAGETAPMTIFYNGSVSILDVSKDKAEYIMKLALEKNISLNNDGQIVDHSSFISETTDNLLGPLNDGDMPIKRKKSLQRFFEKRKERISVSPPYASMDHVVPGVNQPKT